MYRVLIVIVLLLVSSVGQAQSTFETTTYRGVNCGVTLVEEDVKALADLGGNLIRLSFPSNPLMAIDPPYNFNEAAFAYLDSVLHWSDKYGIAVVIDPHRYPGTEHPWTMLGNDPFWQDFAWHEHTIRLWEYIAQRYAQRGDVIAGYDLLNEPGVPKPVKVGSPGDLNLLYAKLTEAIRQYDTQHTIILAAPRVMSAAGRGSYIQGIPTLELPNDEHLAVEFHMYEPQSFSHQGVNEPNANLVEYPGKIEEAMWNKEKIHAVYQPIREFQDQHPQVPLFLGEFSSPRWLGKMGNQYLEDIIQVTEQHNISWTYHAFREASVWNPEHSNTDAADTTRQATTPRLELLTRFFDQSEK
ncbi:MAG: cellulase family glycosylhydrolase [Tunicatimonas sp.]|uniref:glycoside hydrolase family 5 protein n=1 Tax=Tunicatimonas sp. TaxID=1940096 RepID=UPI003C756D02